MAYSIRPATITDIPHIVQHRAGMFREMGIPAAFEDMTAATELWLRHAIPSKTYLGWMAESNTGDVVAGGGLLIIPWPPGPITMDPRCGFIFNVYTQPAHRKQGLAKRVMDAIQKVTGTKMKSQAAGKMGYTTSQIGDLVAEAL